MEHEKTAAALTAQLFDIVREVGLNVDDMRGQGYDNVANMADVHTGVQRRVLDVNPRAVFAPCNNHCLMLLAQSSVMSTTCSIICDVNNILRHAGQALRIFLWFDYPLGPL